VTDKNHGAGLFFSLDLDNFLLIDLDDDILNYFSLDLLGRFFDRFRFLFGLSDLGRHLNRGSLSLGLSLLLVAGKSKGSVLVFVVVSGVLFVVLIVIIILSAGTSVCLLVDGVCGSFDIKETLSFTLEPVKDIDGVG